VARTYFSRSAAIHMWPTKRKSPRTQARAMIYHCPESTRTRLAKKVYNIL
jgi:hypothetical protein